MNNPISKGSGKSLLSQNDVVRWLTAFVALGALIGSSRGTFDVFYRLSGDDLRSWIIVLTTEGGLFLFGLYGIHALHKGVKQTALFTGAVFALYSILIVAIQLADGTLQQVGSVSLVADDRTRFVINNLVWIPPTLTYAILALIDILDTRWTASEARVNPRVRDASRGMWLSMTVWLVTGLGIIGSGIGTFDGFHNLTQDAWRAMFVVMSLEVAILLFSRWAKHANDDTTFQIATVLTLLYFGLAVMFQLVDAATRTGGITASSELVQLTASSLVWITPTFTAIAVFVLHAIDVWNGGASSLFGSPKAQAQVQRPQQGPSPRPQQHAQQPAQAQRPTPPPPQQSRPQPAQRPPQAQQPARATRPVQAPAPRSEAPVVTGLPPGLSHWMHEGPPANHNGKAPDEDPDPFD